MLQGHEALSFVAGYVIKTDGLVGAKCYDEANTGLVEVRGVQVNVAPLEVSHSTILLIKT